jgi:hypothetical protein
MQPIVHKSEARVELKLQSKAGLVEGVHFGFEYHMIDKNGKGLTPPIQCKDFLTDLFWSERTNKPITIYGFKWEPGKLKEADHYYMALKYNNQKMKQYREPLESFLNDWEERLGFPRSDVDLDDDGTALIVRFSRQWTEKPVIFSAFTLFLRVGCQYSGGGISSFLKKFVKQEKVWASVDKNYIGSEKGAARIERMLKGETFKQTYDEFKEAYSIHGQSGLMCWKG